MASAATSLAVAGRSIKLIPRLLSTFVPSLVMPVFLTISFAGQFSGAVNIPGFPAQSMVDWIIPMTTIQGAAFAGITTGMGVARDLENGFYDRLLLSPSSRGSLLAGPLLASMLRAQFPFLLLIIVAIIGDAHFNDGMAGVAVLWLAAVGVSLAAGGWALGLALRFKTIQASSIMQTGVFLSVFLSTAQMPIHLLTGWLQDVARYNPMTYVLQMARQGFLGEVTWAHTWPGLLGLAGYISVLLLFARRQMSHIAE